MKSEGRERESVEKSRGQELGSGVRVMGQGQKSELGVGGLWLSLGLGVRVKVRVRDKLGLRLGLGVRVNFFVVASSRFFIVSSQVSLSCAALSRFFSLRLVIPHLILFFSLSNLVVTCTGLSVLTQFQFSLLPHFLASFFFFFLILPTDADFGSRINYRCSEDIFRETSLKHFYFSHPSRPCEPKQLFNKN